MLTPLSWLKEYIHLPEISQLVERLNQTGTTVESVTEFGQGLSGIVVGEILEVSPHPNADKLQLATVKIPNQTLSIVCGAKNIAAGQKVPVVPVGVSVPFGPNGGPMKITKAKIRGQDSFGMLASPYELGLGDDHSGILILDPSLPVGAKLTSALNLPELVLKTEVTTNRGDELSIYGLAREISAVTGAKLQPLPLPKPVTPAQEKIKLTVSVHDSKLCPRYSAQVVTGLIIGPSPTFIQIRLRASGMRPINNIVDITNYVMLLTGQPLHAFDYDKVATGKIIVRESKVGEKLTTLDGVVRQLGFGSIVISDQEKILGLAGVMGGQMSSVSNLTDTIVLESAVFDPLAIRSTAASYDLRSEASLRFERGVDLEGVTTALSLATDLLQKYAGGKPSSEIIDLYPKPLPPIQVSLSKSKLDQYLGYDYPLTSAAATLSKLGFKTAKKTSNQLTVTTPSWRYSDVSIEEDLIEEVARLEGYDKIPERMPSGEIPTTAIDPGIRQLQSVREHLSSLGLNEVYSYSFVSEKLTMGKAALKISNTISKEWEYLRTSLLPGLAQLVQFNVNNGSEPNIFELGKIYLPKEGDLPYEKYSLAIVGGSFEEVKGYFESILAKLEINGSSYESCNIDFLSEGSSASVRIGEQIVGYLGTSSPALKEISGLKKSVAFGEFDIEEVLDLTPKDRTFQKVAKFPAVTLDISVVVEDTQPISDITSVVLKAGSALLTDVSPSDIFADSRFGPKKKSVTLTLRFQSTDKTLTDAEVKAERDRIERSLKETLKAKIR